MIAAIMTGRRTTAQFAQRDQAEAFRFVLPPQELGELPRYAPVRVLGRPC
jgi:hypothetical protein